MDRNRFIQCMKRNIVLSDKERQRIIRKSVESQPWKLKCTIAMEEFAELTQAISKQIRGYDNRIGLLEEMADAYICLEFLKSIFDITPEELQKAIDVKLQRERNKQRRVKRLKLLEVFHLEESALMYMGILTLRCSRQKILVMLSATAAVTSGECLKCVRMMKS